MPLPQPRQFKPAAGAGRAFVAIIISIILTAAFMAYGIVANEYLNKNYDRYIEAFFGDIFTDFWNTPYDNYIFPWDYNYGDEWGGNYGDEWGDYYDDEWGDEWYYEDGLTENEQAVIDLVRSSTLPGFPEFTIEEVLLSRADAAGLSWNCFEEEGGGEYPIYYAYATGFIDGSFLMIYAGFDVFEDGNIEIYNLDDSERDEYGEDAVNFYAEWYNNMLSGSGNSLSV